MDPPEGHGGAGAAVPRARGRVSGWVPGLVLALVLPSLPGLPGAASPAEAADREPAPVPVAVYVNVDEMSELWPFRDPDTGAFPKEGTPEYAPYRAAWGQVIGQAFRELERRMPKGFALLPARSESQPYAFKIDVWIADMATSCDAPTYYKYLWVRTHTREGPFATNWDGLGVRSETLIRVDMPIRERYRADTDAWIELWAQVPYLHLAPRREAPEEPPPAAGAGGVGL